ncbi:Uncharacterized protein BM_BM10092 [Brugia malayi]|uniref:Bm10092, isoform b n=1 Tax=Brugia malayi TaxID=6279 RepID=A0A4E9FB84_BRUMA|nr:Uncharacterized protein BM_BM10092 [Brugia malayi]VIO94151.1 Uncharacterized protein BM_BM10092 [Brugia malayi]
MKDKKWHGKKSYSFRSKKARIQTSSIVSNEDTCCTLLNPNKQLNRYSSTISCVSSSSSSRSSSVKKGAIQGDFLSSLKLHSEEKLKSISFYIDNREEMVRHMFASLHKRELYELLPENLKNLEIAELRYLCVKELNGMSKKNIYTILKGKDFVESESEGEKNEALTTSTDIKTLKTEVAVADSTTEMTAPNLPGVFQTISTDDITACNSIMSTSEVHFAAVESISLTRTRQESETVIQSDFSSEYKISSSHYADIFASKDTSSPNQVNAVIMAKNDDELEEGEVVSDQEKSTKSDKGDTLKGHQHLTIHRDPFAGNLHGDSSPTSMSKKSGNSGNSADTNKAREERRLHMLELELRARAIEALIRRSDSKP